MEVNFEKLEYKTGTFENEVKVYYNKTNFHKIPFSDLIKKFFSDFHVDECKITEFHCEEIISNNISLMEIRLKFLTIDTEELHLKSEEEQIRILLSKLGYMDKHIQNIEQVNSLTETYWRAKIYHPDFDFDFDEGPSAIGFKRYLEDQLKPVLKFKLVINE